MKILKHIKKLKLLSPIAKKILLLGSGFVALLFVYIIIHGAFSLGGSYIVSKLQCRIMSEYAAACFFIIVMGALVFDYAERGYKE